MNVEIVDLILIAHPVIHHAAIQNLQIFNDYPTTEILQLTTGSYHRRTNVSAKLAITIDAARIDHAAIGYIQIVHHRPVNIERGGVRHRHRVNMRILQRASSAGHVVFANRPALVLRGRNIGDQRTAGLIQYVYRTQKTQQAARHVHCSGNTIQTERTALQRYHIAIRRLILTVHPQPQIAAVHRKIFRTAIPPAHYRRVRHLTRRHANCEVL